MYTAVRTYISYALCNSFEFCDIAYGRARARVCVCVYVISIFGQSNIT